MDSPTWHLRIASLLGSNSCGVRYIVGLALEEKVAGAEMCPLTIEFNDPDSLGLILYLILVRGIRK